jgi:hypothetical protein
VRCPNSVVCTDVPPRYQAGRSELRCISDDGRTARQIATSCHFVSILSRPRDPPTDHLNVVVGDCCLPAPGNRQPEAGPASDTYKAASSRYLVTLLRPPAWRNLIAASPFQPRLRTNSGSSLYFAFTSSRWNGGLQIRYELRPAGRLRKRQPSSAVGKPGVNPDAPPAPLDGRQKQRVSSRIRRQRPRRGGPANRNTDQDVADLTNPEFPALNRFSNPNLHSHAQM